MDQKMFCYQCQETAGCKGCTVVGVCGKQPDVAAMQDLLVWVTKGISAVTTRLREEGRAVADEVNHLVTENLFTTITNANFDKAAIEKRIEKTLEMKTALWEQLERRDNLPEAAGCAKYRYNKLNLGDIEGIPRVLDAGQCNDSYSLAVIAMKLQEIFGLDDINDLPIIYNIAWYEQKAVIVLLALLSLGIKNIHLGPTLPAFLSPNVVNVLVEKFGIAGIDSVESDVELFFGEK